MMRGDQRNVDVPGGRKHNRQVENAPIGIWDLYFTTNRYQKEIERKHTRPSTTKYTRVPHKQHLAGGLEYCTTGHTHSPFCVRQELSIKCQHDAITVGVLLLIDVDFAVDHGHDAIPEFLMDDSLYGMTVY